MKRFGVAAALLSLLIACAAAGQSGAAPRQGALKVRAKGRRSVVVTERGRAHTLDLTGQIDAMRIEKVSAPFVSRAGGFTYLLLDVCGLSKVPPDDRQCGAGTECNVVWLKLDAAWRVRGAQNQRYESCWSPVTLDDEKKFEGRRLSFAVDDFREDVRREVTYDADNPEAGLTVKQTPLPKTP
ncbi:MAG: hypothetical protein JOZ02_06335 [Acidobacteria bacterium]|nr:hypothetical protein [Acidobacteriota bacterium]